MNATYKMGVAVLGALLIHCGGDDDASGNIESCNIPKGNSCTEYRGSPEGVARQLCSLDGTTYAAAACSKEGVVGGCRGSGFGEYTTWHRGLSADQVKEQCAKTTPKEEFVTP